MATVGVELEHGTVVGGYRIERFVGRGGMGAVYLAEHVRLQRKVALKVLSQDLAADRDFQARFIRESQLAASLEHPNVIPIYDADEQDGLLYIAMRYVEGDDLRELLTRTGPVTPERALAVLTHVAAALDAAHDADFVHRDVKPANILIERLTDHVYLSDFGLARKTEASGLTKTGSFLGSVDYCAPEQIEGGAIDRRVDVYALGGVLFHCLTGQRPYPRETEVAVIKAHLIEPPPAVTTLRPDLPPSLDGVVATAMAKHPEVRFRAASEVIMALAAALSDSGQTTRATVPQPPRATLPGATVAESPPTREAPLPRPAPTASSATGGHTKRIIIGSGIAALIVLGAVLALRSLTSGSAGDSTSTNAMTPAAQLAAFDDGLVRAVAPVAERQRLLTQRVQSAQATPTSFAGIRRAASGLETSVLKAHGSLDALTVSGPDDRDHRAAVRQALNAHSSYAKSMAQLPEPSTFRPAAARIVAEKAATTAAVYETASIKVPALPDMPLQRADHAELTRIAVCAEAGGCQVDRGDRADRRVPATYLGPFTSTDRLQRCNATSAYVYCSSGPSGRAVRLNIGRGVVDLGRRASADRGGSSMPMGTSFTTPDGRVSCDSSLRGIRCTDLTNGEYFVIGDTKLITSNSARAYAFTVGVPPVYTGPFNAVDRLERCYATDAYAMCTAGPSGKRVRLVAGQGVYYEGIIGSADRGGPSMPMGTSFRTPRGTIACDSSTRGITCIDRRTGAYFVIGDYIVRVNNGAGESRH